MSGRDDSPLAPEQIAAVKDEDIDFSDIPELDEDFWKRAELVEPIALSPSSAANDTHVSGSTQCRTRPAPEGWTTAQQSGVIRIARISSASSSVATS